jgi:hypothetical protein
LWWEGWIGGRPWRYDDSDSARRSYWKDPLMSLLAWSVTMCCPLWEKKRLHQLDTLLITNNNLNQATDFHQFLRGWLHKRGSSINQFRSCGAAPYQDHHSLQSEVLTRMTILHKSAHYNRHNAINDLPQSREAWKFPQGPFYTFKGYVS